MIVEDGESFPSSPIWLPNQYATSAGRVATYGDSMYAIIGYVRDTKNQPGGWVDGEGKSVDFEYIEEHVVGSGSDYQELRESVRDHKRAACLPVESKLLSK